MNNIVEWHHLIMPIILPEMCHLATVIAIFIDWLEYLVHLKEKKKETKTRYITDLITNASEIESKI